MTAPTRHRASVDQEQPPIGFELARHRLIPPDRGRRGLRRMRREHADQLLEDAAAMLVIFKLIEAGAGRRQQNGVARPRAFEGQLPRRAPAFPRAPAARRRRAALRSFPPPRRSAEPCARALPQRLGSGAKSLPLSLPPRITSRPPGKASSALSVASTLVALESLKKLHAADFGDKFEAVLDAGKGAHARGDRRGLDSSKNAAAAAARTFSTLCSPRKPISPRLSRAISSPSRRKTIWSPHR